MIIHLFLIIPCKADYIIYLSFIKKKLRFKNIVFKVAQLLSIE